MKDEDLLCPGMSGRLCARHDGRPCVDRGQSFMVSSFMAGQGAKAGGIAYSEKVAPTLKGADSGLNQVPTVCYPTGIHCMNTFDSQTHRVYGADGVWPALVAGENSGQNRQAVCYDTTQITNPKSGGNPRPGGPCHCLAANQHPPLVIALQGNGIDRADTAGCNGCGWKANVGYTLNTVDRHAIAFDARNMKATPVSGTLQAEPNGGHSLSYTNPACFRFRGYGDYTESSVSSTQKAAHDQNSTDMVVDPSCPYIVRRLTPIECARLQGFPDWWGSIADKKLQSDTAQYRMWGNGLALPCAVYVLRGIARALRTG